jgi:hypothetical protein
MPCNDPTQRPQERDVQYTCNSRHGERPGARAPSARHTLQADDAAALDDGWVDEGDDVDAEGDGDCDGQAGGGDGEAAVGGDVEMDDGTSADVWHGASKEAWQVATRSSTACSCALCGMAWHGIA